MKNQTKLKIINLVKKVLRYKEPIIPPTIEEKRQIKLIQCRHYFTHAEMQHKNYVLFNILQEIAKGLQKSNLVKIEKREIHEGVEVTAELYVIGPLNT